MIKLETLGMLDVAKVNPVLKKNAVVKNHSFVTDGNGTLYLVANTLTGDDTYREGIEFKANAPLNGFDVKAWEGQKLVIDAKHITFGVGETYASNITAGTTLLKVNASDELVIAAEAPASGIYFKVTEKCQLTGDAVKALVIVADKDTVYEP